MFSHHGSNLTVLTGPNERRTIVREELGHYYAVIVGALYEFPSGIPLDSPTSYYSPVKACIDEHAFLCAIVQARETEKPFFQQVPSIDLQNHISIAHSSPGEADLVAIERVLGQALDQPFPAGIPPWRVIVLPLQSSRALVVFAYSHTIGDGPSGTAFHTTFRTAYKDISVATSLGDSLIKIPPRRLPEPFDTSKRLPISWSFLLAPLVAHLLPKFFMNLFGLQADVTDVDKHTWTGADVPQQAPKLDSRLRLGVISPQVLQGILTAARSHDTTFTGVVNEVIARAIYKQAQNPAITKLVSQTAINMRRSIGVSNNEMGEYASGCYTVHSMDELSDSFTDKNWSSAREASRRFAECATNLQDQPIGLLRYIPSIKNWTLGKLGQQRSCSFETSNVGVVDVGLEKSSALTLDLMFFGQPGHMVGAALAFNFVSVRGGSLAYTVTWQAGALGVSNEDEFVYGLCKSLESELSVL